MNENQIKFFATLTEEQKTIFIRTKVKNEVIKENSYEVLGEMFGKSRQAIQETYNKTYQKMKRLETN